VLVALVASIAWWIFVSYFSAILIRILVSRQIWLIMLRNHLTAEFNLSVLVILLCKNLRSFQCGVIVLHLIWIFLDCLRKRLVFILISVNRQWCCSTFLITVVNNSLARRVLHWFNSNFIIPLILTEIASYCLLLELFLCSSGSRIAAIRNRIRWVSIATTLILVDLTSIKIECFELSWGRSILLRIFIFITKLSFRKLWNLDLLFTLNSKIYIS